MDDDTIEELPAVDDPIDTIPDNIALELEVGDRTVVTSAAAPEPDDAPPWTDRHLILGGVYFASGSVRFA